jgi:large conductance mechanosensitive channel
MRGILDEFKAFIFRGNLIELAVAFVLGLAFAALVTAFVADLITPIIAAIFGKPDFSSLDFTINGSRFAYGDFINALISFLAIAAAIFFFVVKPAEMIMSRRAAADPATRECPECLSLIPVGARRCASCTSEVGPAPAV